MEAGACGDNAFRRYHGWIGNFRFHGWSLWKKVDLCRFHNFHVTDWSWSGHFKWLSDVSGILVSQCYRNLWRLSIGIRPWPWNGGKEETWNVRCRSQLLLLNRRSAGWGHRVDWWWLGQFAVLGVSSADYLRCLLLDHSRVNSMAHRQKVLRRSIQDYQTRRKRQRGWTFSESFDKVRARPAPSWSPNWRQEQHHNQRNDTSRRDTPKASKLPRFITLEDSGHSMLNSLLHLVLSRHLITNLFG